MPSKLLKINILFLKATWYKIFFGKMDL